MAGVIVEPHAFLNLNVTVGHGARIGSFCTCNPGAHISGNVTLGDHVLVGTGAQIIEKINVGEGSIIGAGACVTKHVPDGVIAKGVPAKWS
jgi:acetyltransferase-like isoleucine patch superfamily enzyme